MGRFSTACAIADSAGEGGADAQPPNGDLHTDKAAAAGFSHGGANACAASPPLIDAQRIWDESDKHAGEFARTMSELWSESAGEIYDVLTQRHFFKYYAIVVLFSVLYYCFSSPYVELISSVCVVVDCRLTPVVAPTVAGLATYLVSLIAKIPYLSAPQAIRCADIGNAIQDRMREEIVLKGGHAISVALQNLEIGREDSGARAERCIGSVYSAWRKIQLIPRAATRDWNIFRVNRITNVDVNIRGIVFWWVNLAVFLLLSAWPVFGLLNADAASDSAGGALTGVAGALSSLMKHPGLANWLSAQSVFLVAAISLRRHFLARSRKLIDAIEQNLQWHQVGATEKRKWNDEIASLDPLPQIARKHREALEAVSDLMRGH